MLIWGPRGQDPLLEWCEAPGLRGRHDLLHDRTADEQCPGLLSGDDTTHHETPPTMHRPLNHHMLATSAQPECAA